MSKKHPRIGFHTAGSGGNPTGLGDKYVKRAHDAGAPVVISCADGFVGIGDALANPHPDDVLIFRVVRNAEEEYAVPDYGASPEVAATKYWDLIKEFIPREVDENKDKIWIAYGNELDQERAEWLFAWSEQMARLLNGLGYKAVGPNWAAGTPDYDDWETTAAGSFLRYCGDNPEMSAVGIHEYSYTIDDLFDGDGHKVGRYRYIVDVCSRNGIPRPTILIKEFGYSNNDVPSPSRIVSDLDELFKRYPDYPPAALWWLGPWFGDIANKLARAIGNVGDFVATHTYEVDDVPRPASPVSRPSPEKPADAPEVKTKTVAEAPVTAFPARQGLALDFFELQAGDSDFRINGQLWFRFRYDNSTGGDVRYGGAGVAVHKWDGQKWNFHYYKHSYGGPNGRLRPEGGPGSAGEGWRDNYKADDVGVFALAPFLTFDPDAHSKEKRANPGSIQDGFHMGPPVYVRIGSHIETGEVLAAPPAPLFAEPEKPKQPDKPKEKPTGPGTDAPTGTVRPARIKHSIWLLPPGSDEEKVVTLTRARFRDRTAFTWSADVVHAVMEDGAPGSVCIVVDGDEWPADIYAWLDKRGIAYEKFDSSTLMAASAMAIEDISAVEEPAVGEVLDAKPAEEEPAAKVGKTVAAADASVSTAKAKWPNLDPATFGPVFNQRDPRWAKTPLGYKESPTTIGEWGCLGVAYAMLAHFMGLTDDTPDTFINETLAKSGAMHRRFVQPGAVATAFPDKVAYDGFLPQRDSRMVPQIKAYLDAGYPVVARVDREPGTERKDQHWILLIGYEGEDWIMADPFRGAVMKVEDAYDIQGQDILEAIFYYFKDQPRPKGAVEIDLSGPPARPAVGKYRGPKLPVSPFRGLHGRSTRHPLASDHEAFKRGGFNAIMIQSGVTPGELHGYGAKFALCRIFESFHNRTRTPADFVRDVQGDVRQIYDAGVRYFFAGNEPNLDYENPVLEKGAMGSRTGRQFGEWLLEVHRLLRAQFPEIKLGWPALSPGGEQDVTFGHDSGYREADSTFMDGAKKTTIFSDCDFITCHAYFVNWKDITEAENQVRAYRNTFPKQLIYVTEATNPTAPPVDKLGKQMAEFYRRCDGIPGVGAFFYLSSGPGWDHSALVDDSGKDRGVLAHMKV